MLKTASRIALLLACFLMTALAAENHPKINQAINALQSARTDLQNAAHDYCGHRVEALESVNTAIKQLQLALASDRASLSIGDSQASASVAAGERHPLIRKAINALEGAKGDLENAAHDFHGHRVEALESVNAALNQLHAAIACDKN